MKDDIIYISKRFTKSSVVVADEGDEFLGYVKIDVATTHKDRVKDVLTKSFIEKTTSDLSVNTSFFKNHNTHEDPVGRIMKTETYDLGEGNFSSRVTVGISKTAPKVWALIKDGSYNKASIGFMPDYDTMRYDEETDTLYIHNGLILEASIVGVPANGEAGVVSEGKSLSANGERLRKIAKQKMLENNKQLNTNNEDIDVNEDQLKSLFDKFEKSIDEKLKTLVKPEIDESPKDDEIISAFEKKLQEVETKFIDKLKDSNEKLKEYENEIKRLQQEGGRKTSANSKTDEVDKYHIENENLALLKGFRTLGQIIKSREPFNLTFLASTESDLVDEGLDIFD